MINQFQNFKLKLFQNKKTKTILVFLLFFLFPLTSLFSYNDTDTHPDLTVEIVKLYNLQSKENKLLGEEMELVRQGSMLEDTAPRWINHFYNPETGEGWTADNLKGVSQKNMRTVSDWFLSSEKPVSSLNWARNQELQNRYSLYQGNHTWQKAVYDYASGNKEQGLRSLGFLLHLIEDASVPDHTRDDTHADISNKKDNADEGSPYEDWAENYTKNNILTIAETLNNQNKKYYKCGNFDECLINLAKYSHYNFFSEDTIFEFESPKIFREEKLNDKNYYYNENENILAKSYEIEDNKIYTLRDPLIMSSYWSYLSSEAVLTGAGVIETFFKDVEKAKSDPQYLENLKFKEKQMTLAQSSFMPVVFLFADKMISPAGEIFRIGRAYSGAKDTVNNFANNIVSVVKSLFGATGNQQAGLPVLELSGNANSANQDADATAQARSQQGEAPLLNGFEEGGETSSGINNQMAPDVLTNQSQDNFAPSPQKPPTSAVNQTLNNNTNNQTSNNAALNSTQNQNKQNSDDVPTPNFGFAGFYGAASGPPPGFGGGEAVPPRRDGNNQLPIINNQTNSNNQNQNENQNTASSTNATSTENQIEPDTTPPESPVLLFPSDLNQTFNSQSVEFSGTAEPSSTLLAKSDLASKATTTVSGTGIWSLLLTLNQGTTTISFFARDQNGNQSSSTDIEVFIDSLAPQISDFKILECDNSMAADGCLIATTTINLIWSANSDDLDYYELSYENGVIATTSTSTVLILENGKSYNFSLRARDKNGNWSEIETATVEINSQPIIINEIAWMGTGPQTSSDEWVELYNRTNKEINLNSFTLYASDLKPYMPLQGNVAAKDYFLLERTDDDNTVLDIKADQFFTGSIENQREDLFLVYISHNGTTTIDYTKSCTQFGHWCGGSTNGYASMERYSPDEDNWGTNLMLIKNGQNAKGGAINGTPKARNSLNYLITSRSENRITKDIVLKKENSPYFVYDTVTVPQGKKLTIEPGVVIKFRGNGNNFLNIEGELVAEGREGGENKIVFTSFYDDKYGGDTDGDSGASLLRPGDWTSVSLQNNSSSTISHSLFRYGGAKSGMFCCNAMLNVEATSTITNSIFEYSYGYGAQIINNGSVIADNIFRNNNNYPQFSGAAGVNIGAGAPKIINNIFEENYYGTYVSGGSEAEFEDNVFNNNASKAVFVSGNDGIGTFKNNSGILTADPRDGIYITNLRLKQNAATTLYSNSNSLPYVFHNNPYIAASSSLVIKSGVLIKNTESNRIEVYGALYTEGENPQDIVFTALSDNSYWFGVSANPGSTVVLKGTTIKRGGKISSFGAEKEAALYANKADINLENVLFEENYKNGAVFVNSSSLIKNSEFKNHTLPETGSRALSYYGSEINLENTTFRKNFLGIYADANSLLGTIISPIIFEGNTGTSTVNLFP